MSTQSIIDRVREHFYLGQYNEAVALARSVPSDSADYGTAQILLMRSLFNRGHIDEANQASQLALHQAVNKADQRELQLWAALVGLYLRLPSPTDEDWYAVTSLCSAVTAEADMPPHLYALAIDMEARLSNLRFGLGWATQADKEIVLARHRHAADAYRVAGDARESFGARQRYANLLRSAPFPNYAEAISALTAIQHDAGDAQLPVPIAEAKLEEAILRFRTAHIGDQIADTGPVLQLFDDTRQMFEAVGHKEGSARVRAEFADVLFKHCYSDGVTWAHQAIQALADVGDEVNRQSLWRELHKWHLQHGESDEMHKAHHEATQISQAMRFQLTNVVDLQGQADMAFRSGHVAEALNLLAQAGANPKAPIYDGPNAAPWLIRASVLSQVGRIDEAVTDLRAVIAALSLSGASPFLADAWSQLGHTLLGRNDAEAISCLEQGAQLAHQLGDDIGAAKLLSQKAWLQVQQRYRANESPVFIDEIDVAFNEARAILLKYRTMDARVELGSLCGLRGQAAFLIKDYEACGKWYSLAEDLYQELGFKPQLAFTLTNQGLVLIEAGRTRGLSAYNPAFDLLGRARQLFEETQMHGIAWRAEFYQGLCAFEAGRYEKPDSLEQQTRWLTAQALLEEAADRIDQLRGSAAESSTTEGQASRIAFGLDKQVIYSTGLKLTLDYQHRPDAALRWLERAKARALLDELAKIDLPVPLQLRDHPLIQRERKLTREKQQTTDGRHAIDLQMQIDQLLRQLASDPATADYADLRQGDAIDWLRLRQLLQEQGLSQLLIVVYYCTPTSSFALGLRSEWDIPRVAPIDVDYKVLRQFIEHHLRQPDGFRMLLEDFGDSSWQQFSGLIEPLADWSKVGDTICFVPHGILHDTPLHILQLADQYLIKRNPVCYVVSTSVLYYLLRRNITGHTSYTRAITVLGDARQNLPKSRSEAIAIAQQMKCQPILGKDVDRQALIDALHHSEIVHLAGHAEAMLQKGLNGCILLSGQERLTAGEFMLERISAKLTVLSGCETGLSQHEPNDELIGLVRALQIAGASSLLVSQWRVNDASTEALLSAFYQFAYGSQETVFTLAQALQKAVIDVSKYEKWNNPYYWGGFVLIGDWR